jgi:hypothetical protein
MTTHASGNPRRLRATIIGVGLDGGDALHRLITGDDCLVVGGSAETHAELVEMLLRLQAELDRLGRRLADLAPAELMEIAWRIDSPELHRVALRLKDGLERLGRPFEEATAEELTALASAIDP